MFTKGYANVFTGDANWSSIKTPAGKIYAWDGKSTYVKNPPYFDGMTMTPAAVGDIKGARALAVLGDSVTTDHISPAGNISKSSPAAKYLLAQGVQAVDFNSYGARRGNHEVMMRGTFANIRLRNLLLPGTEGGVTLHIPSGESMSIFDASVKYKAAATPLVILAGKEYGTGSSRDWAAKGTMLLGVKAVIAESFERIHRSNLIGMGVLPLQYKDGQNAQTLGLTGKERFEILGLNRGAAKVVKVVATADDGKKTEFEARLRIDTPEGTRLLPARRDPAIRAAAACRGRQGGLSGGFRPGLPPRARRARFYSAGGAAVSAFTLPASTSTMVPGSRWVLMALLIWAARQGPHGFRVAVQPTRHRSRAGSRTGWYSPGRRSSTDPRNIRRSNLVCARQASLSVTPVGPPLVAALDASRQGPCRAAQVRNSRRSPNRRRQSMSCEIPAPIL